ncbi:MAG: hypothetical protein ACMXYK_05065 [Candidatus Woesearchaeota archaeon]
MSRSQVSVELMIMLAVGLIVVIILLQIRMERNRELQYLEDANLAKEILFKIGSTINEIHTHPLNSNTTIYVPATINTNYTLGIIENLLILESNRGFFTYPLVTSNISLVQTDGTYLIKKTEYGVSIT